MAEATDETRGSAKTKCLNCGLRHDEESVLCPRCKFHRWEVYLINRRLNLRLCAVFVILYIAMILYLSR